MDHKYVNIYRIYLFIQMKQKDINNQNIQILKIYKQKKIYTYIYIYII